MRHQSESCSKFTYPWHARFPFCPIILSYRNTYAICWPPLSTVIKVQVLPSLSYVCSLAAASSTLISSPVYSTTTSPLATSLLANAHPPAPLGSLRTWWIYEMQASNETFWTLTENLTQHFTVIEIKLTSIGGTGGGLSSINRSTFSTIRRPPKSYPGWQRRARLHLTPVYPLCPSTTHLSTDHPCRCAYATMAFFSCCRQKKHLHLNRSVNLLAIFFSKIFRKSRV